ncbi:hypothetical protein [Flavobacterium sp.]|uniref:hypothetical protein n=1 Tax=Flavobacterium sp. TaxID=239 RepID=UPI0025C586F4|nr:hypothetical protein [Flavobacterium sp.]MBA4153808.1 hypothetical protein [Flavobacterium sp.]
MKKYLILFFILFTFGNSCFSQIVNWPRTLTNKSSVLTMYQPQVEDWQDYKNITYRLAFSLVPNSSDEVLGVLYMTAKTEVNKEKNTVLISNMVITKVHFPYEDASTAKNLEPKVRSFLEPNHTLTMSLNQVVACTPKEQKTSNVVVNNDPPILFHSTTPAVLFQLTGPMVKAASGQPNLDFIVNANFPVFVDTNSNFFYLYDGLEWQTASAINGPWKFTSTVPNSIVKLSSDKVWDNLKGAIPAKTKPNAKIPEIIYSDKLAELILFEGNPTYSSIKGTSLKFATNTTSDLFFCSTDNQYYYLSSGRWFSSQSLNGPWVFASSNLPADFLHIPNDSPASSILAFVPGSEQAADAVMIAQIPTTINIPKDAANSVNVIYSGEPKFEPIETTTLSYAVNTSSKVIMVAKKDYFVCENGIWFEANSPNGPWIIATYIPAEIYKIPASSPVYNVTYVTQKEDSSGAVVSSYTSGYEGVYVVNTSTTVVIISGTGFYYPPYYYYPPYGYPVYYHYPYTYGCYAYHAYPYGGVSYHASYNPNTGTYARSATAYGPYGSATGAQAYNPSTGTVARGASASTAYGTTSAAQAYNPYTGGSATTRQTSNAYGSYGTTTRTNAAGKTTTTAHQTTSQGTTASAANSQGGKAVAGSGQNNSGAAVKTASGDKYASVNGNVYSNTGDGWQQGGSGNAQAQQQPQNQTQNQAQTKSQTQTPSNVPKNGSQSAANQTSSHDEMNKASSDRQRGNTQTQQYQGRMSGGSSSGRASGGGRPSGGGRSRGRG